MSVHLYTDGGASPNPGAGGWGVAIIDRAVSYSPRRLDSGRADSTTNNRMELMAFIAALRHIINHGLTDAVIHADSKYVIDGYQSYLGGWIAKDFRGVKNDDLWRDLAKLKADAGDIEIVWVKGHSGNAGNELADEIATRERLGQSLTNFADAAEAQAAAERAEAARRIKITLTAEELDQLNTAAKALGLDNSELVHRLVFGALGSKDLSA